MATASSELAGGRAATCVGRSILTAILALSAGMVCAEEVVPIDLSPAGRWNIEYHPQMCVLSRSYAVNTGATTLGFQTATADTLMMLIVARPADGNRSNRRTRATVVADGVTIADRVEAMSRTVPVTGAHLDTMTISRDAVPAVEKAARIAIAVDGKPVVGFVLSGTTKAMAALAACERDLKASWGFDMAALDRIAVPAKPIGDLSRHFSVYPSEARAAGQSGRAVAILTVDIHGNVTDCRIAVSSKVPSLDKAACAIPKISVRYEPARDAAGHPIVSQQYLVVNWQFEG